jgi:hypothetical protein
VKNRTQKQYYEKHGTPMLVDYVKKEIDKQVISYLYRSDKLVILLYIDYNSLLFSVVHSLNQC